MLLSSPERIPFFQDFLVGLLVAGPDRIAKPPLLDNIISRLNAIWQAYFHADKLINSLAVRCLDY
jgi:hypothetical protein